jgi:hypothetical protein
MVLRHLALADAVVFVEEPIERHETESALAQESHPLFSMSLPFVKLCALSACFDAVKVLRPSLRNELMVAFDELTAFFFEPSPELLTAWRIPEIAERFGRATCPSEAGINFI